MAIKARAHDFRPHVQGAFSTTWHYRTSHSYAHILAAGDDYWVPVLALIKPFDTIWVQDENCAWEYTAIVLRVDESEEKCYTKIGKPEPTNDGVFIYDQEAIDKKIQDMASKEAAAEEREAELEGKRQALDTAEMQPQAKFKGPKDGKWCILAYEATIGRDYPNKESAMRVLNGGDLDEKIKAARKNYMTKHGL